MRRGNGWENVGKESHTVPQNSHGRFIGGKGENAEIASGVENRRVSEGQGGACLL